MPFDDRTDAGRQLAGILAPYRNQKSVVLALPRGGVTVAAEIAAALSAPLDLIFVRKIGVPQQPELAMGAVVDGGSPMVVRNEDVIAFAEVSERQFQVVYDHELAEVERRRARYLGDRERVDLADCVAIVVDDGVATGATALAALRAARLRNPAKLVLAVPVGPRETIAQLRAEADDLICLEEYEFFAAIGTYYADFGQVSDQTVIDTLRRFPARPAAAPRPPAS
jgi:putative phosphoribosyl transferase